MDLAEGLEEDEIRELAEALVWHDFRHGRMYEAFNQCEVCGEGEGVRYVFWRRWILLVCGKCLRVRDEVDVRLSRLFDGAIEWYFLKLLVREVEEVFDAKAGSDLDG